MKTALKTTAISTLAFLALGVNAQAFTPMSPLTENFQLVQHASYESTSTVKPVEIHVPTFNTRSTIGIARIDNGRMIAAPMSETRSWTKLNANTGQKFAMIAPGAVLKNIPEVPMDGKDSMNKLDEIRMTASDLRMDYVLVYGMGDDARWGSFAKQSMMNTGFIVDENMYVPGGNTKALLVNTYTGEIYGTMTSDDNDQNISKLTQKVQTLIEKLHSPNTIKA